MYRKYIKYSKCNYKNNEVKYEKLWTENGEGELPEVYCSDNEYDEGKYIVDKIEELRKRIIINIQILQYYIE